MPYVIIVKDAYKGKEKALVVKNQVLQFNGDPSSCSSFMKLDTSGYTVKEGRVTITDTLLDTLRSEDRLSVMKRFLLNGVSSFIHLLDINYEQDSEAVLSNSRSTLQFSPLDYIHAVRLPLERLTPSWVRKLKKLNVNIIVFHAEDEDTVPQKPWQLLLEAAFPVRMMFIFDDGGSGLPSASVKQQRDKWTSIVKEKRINSYFHLPDNGDELPRLFLKRSGLYPWKGSLDSGNDADFFLYRTENAELTNVNIPEIIVLKGEVIKAGTTWNIERISGKELTSVIPEQFLSIHEVNQYE